MWNHSGRLWPSSHRPPPGWTGVIANLIRTASYQFRVHRLRDKLGAVNMPGDDFTPPAPTKNNFHCHAVRGHRTRRFSRRMFGVSGTPPTKPLLLQRDLGSEKAHLVLFDAKETGHWQQRRHNYGFFGCALVTQGKISRNSLRRNQLGVWRPSDSGCDSGNVRKP